MKEGLLDMFNKNTHYLSLCAILFATSPVMAATGDMMSKTINISASIPSATFDLVPVNTGRWPTNVDLTYLTPTQSANASFAPYILPLKVTVATGLTASLVQPAVLRNGTADIPLTVTIGSTTLTTKPLGIYEKPSSNTEPSVTQNMELRIKPTGTTRQSVTGIYTGSISLVFEDTF
jgi:hypothetical protein